MARRSASRSRSRTTGPARSGCRPMRRAGGRLRIGIVVPLASVLNLDDTPGELADRSALIPAEFLRQLIADTLGPDPSSHDEVLFTRLLTDSAGRLLDSTELGRYPSRRLAEAIMIRAGTCRFPTCIVPANRCDLDHHQPWPHGPTSAETSIRCADDITAARPLPGKPASAITTAPTGPCPTTTAIDAKTNRYRPESRSSGTRRRALLLDRKSFDAHPASPSTKFRRSAGSPGSGHRGWDRASGW